MENIFDTSNIKISLDTSSLTTTQLSDDSFKAIIEDKLQDVLNKTFKDNREKRYIKHLSNSLNFACPFCRDSATDYKKKRGHLLLDGKWAGRFKCFNCGETMKFQQFFKKFDKELSLSELNYINKELPEDSSYYNELSSSVTSNIINKSEAYKFAIERKLLKSTLSLQDIGRTTTPIAWNYLVSRCQYNNLERFLYSPKYNQLWILNLVDDKVLGLQIRKIDYNGVGPKYLTMTIDKLREAILGDKNKIPDYIQNLSCVFNIFNVDFAHTTTKPILVTEGPFDAFLLPNCIALSGASKNFNMNFPFWYVYDNDETGNKHALEELKKGYNVFMWKKFKKEYNIPDINPYISSGNKRKWDITDIVKYLRDTNGKKVYWSPYFTNNMLDALNI